MSHSLAVDRRPKLPAVVLISGSGTTLRNLLKRIDQQRLDLDIRLVISSSAKAKGLRFAEEAGIPARVIRQADSPSPELFSEAIFSACREANAELVVMGGFLKHVLIPPDFENRVTNIHPGLIPAFCGKGYYGLRVHQAVLEYGAKISGCTVHFVDNQYDHGPILLQRVVPVLENDTPERLAQRVFELETIAYPEALQLIAEGRVQVDNRCVQIR